MTWVGLAVYKFSSPLQPGVEENWMKEFEKVRSFSCVFLCKVLLCNPAGGAGRS